MARFTKCLSDNVKERYKEKMDLCGGIDPYQIKGCELSDNYKMFPKTTFFDVSNYLVDGTSFVTSNAFRAYKSLDAWKWHKSGWVTSLKIKSLGNRTVVIGKVRQMHSYKSFLKHIIFWLFLCL